MTSATATRRSRVSTVQSGHPDEVEIDPGVFEVPDEEEGSRVEERAPKIPTPTVAEQVEALRINANSARQKITERAAKLTGRTPSTRKTGIKRPRSSVEGLISTVWGIGARVVGQLGMYPVANVLALQSPVAGKILEDTVKNTAVDTVLQPFARLANGSQVGLALLGPPILCGVAAARPETQPIVEPLLREALRAWLTVAGPKMAEKAEEERKFQEEYGQTIDEMIRFIFTPPEGMATDVHSGETVSA